MQVKKRFTSRALGTVLVFGLLVGFIVGERLSPYDFGANAAPRNPRSLVGEQGLFFYPLASPIRLLDTRKDAPALISPNRRIPGGTEIRVPAIDLYNVLGIAGGARAIAGNATVVAPGDTQPGVITLYSGEEGRPNTSNLNYNPGQTVANNFTVRMESDTSFTIHATTTTDIIIDVTGFYAVDGAITTPIPPGGAATLTAVVRDIAATVTADARNYNATSTAVYRDYYATSTAVAREGGDYNATSTARAATSGAGTPNAGTGATAIAATAQAAINATGTAASGAINNNPGGRPSGPTIPPTPANAQTAAAATTTSQPPNATARAATAIVPTPNASATQTAVAMQGAQTATSVAATQIAAPPTPANAPPMRPAR